MIFLATTNTMGNIFDRNNFQCKHKLKYHETIDEQCMSLSIKQIDFLPNSNQLYGYSSNNSIYIWANYNFQLIKHIQTIKARETFLKKSNAILMNLNEMQAKGSHNNNINDDPCSLDILLKSITKDFSGGLINAICFSENGQFMCVCTIDDYIMVFTTANWKIEILIETPNISIMQCIFVPSSGSSRIAVESSNKRGVLAVVTSLQNALLIDLNQLNVKPIIIGKAKQSKTISIARNGLMMAIVLQSGEVFVYNLQLLLNKINETQSNVDMITDDNEKHQQHYNWVNNKVSL